MFRGKVKEHKVTLEQIQALLQGKTLRIRYGETEIVLYPPQDVLTFSPEEIEKLQREAGGEAIKRAVDKKERFIEFILER